MKLARRLRVIWVLDWFAYYSAGVLSSLAETTDVMVVTRDHGFELGEPEDPQKAMRELFPRCKEVVLVRGRQSDPRSFYSAWRARRQVRSFHPDVIHVQDHFDWRLWFATVGLSVPRVVTIHDVVPHLGWLDPRSGTQRGVERIVRASADALCVHGTALATRVAEQPWYKGQPVYPIPLGVQAHPRSLQPLPTRPTVLFFGRIEQYKGVGVFAAAMQAAARRLPGLRGIVAGAGTVPHELMESTAGLIEWRIGFVRDDELPALFAESSIVALPYLEASQSGVVPVAFANGRSVVASRTGALAEAVCEGVNGIFVEPGDADQLADAFVQVLSDPTMLQRLSTGALETIQGGCLSPGAVTASHLHVYESVTGGCDG